MTDDNEEAKRRAINEVARHISKITGVPMDDVQVEVATPENLLRMLQQAGQRQKEHAAFWLHRLETLLSEAVASLVSGKPPASTSRDCDPDGWFRETMRATHDARVLRNQLEAEVLQLQTMMRREKQ